MDARVSILVVAFALALAVPLAAADHVFSHRIYVVGRVVDSEGLPAPGLSVNVSFEGFQPTSRCFDSKEETTGPQGDFEVCRHSHTIPSGASALVRVGGLEERVAVDPELRHANVRFQLAEPTTVHDVNGERLFARTFLATGRAFALLPDAENAEGVVVNATPIVENVTVRLVEGERVLAEKTVSPNEHGTYRAELSVEAIPAGALVRVSTPGAASEELASSLFRRADVNLVRDLRLIHGPGDDAPGSAPVPWPIWVVMLSIGAATVALRRRR